VVAVDFETAADTVALVAYADFLWHPRHRPQRSVSARVRERGRLLDQDGAPLTAGRRRTADLRRLATRAAAEVVAFREGFRTLAAWAAYLDRSADEGGLWRQADAAVATALTGDGERSRHWFDRVLDRPVRPELYPDPDADDVPQAQRWAIGLLAHLADPAAFGAAAAELASGTRARLGLASIELT
jgi:hypothetical protein